MTVKPNVKYFCFLSNASYTLFSLAKFQPSAFYENNKHSHNETAFVTYKLPFCFLSNSSIFYVVWLYRSFYSINIQKKVEILYFHQSFYPMKFTIYEKNMSKSRTVANRHAISHLPNGKYVTNNPLSIINHFFKKSMRLKSHSW